MNSETINITILEDHQSIIDGYLYRLVPEKGFNINGVVRYGEDLLPMLRTTRCDVLILDLQVPTSATNSNSFPVLNNIPVIRTLFPDLVVLVISMHSQRVLSERLFEMGVKGFIFKDDNQAIENLDNVVVKLKNGGSYFSIGDYEKLKNLKSENAHPLLSARQMEALSLCVAFPDCSSEELANRLGVSSSTFRNLLSNAYSRLGVRTRVAAIAELQKLGIGPTGFNGQMF